MMPEVIASAERLKKLGITAGVVCLTSPDLVFESLQRRNSRNPGTDGNGFDIIDALFPPHAPRPLVTVQDGHPHTLSFLAGARGDRTAFLGVKDFGQSSDLQDAYRTHGIDEESIVNAALNLVR
jgi:pyruvate dehydrogenase E1 component